MAETFTFAVARVSAGDRIRVRWKLYESHLGKRPSLVRRGAFTRKGRTVTDSVLARVAVRVAARAGLYAMAVAVVEVGHG